MDALFGNSLFTQEASGRFELNESYSRTSWGLVFADFDRDSDDDIVDYYAAGYPNNTSGSFVNDGSGAFSDATAYAGLGTEKGFDIGTLIGSAILTETVFNWPGMGSKLADATSDRDLPVMLGLTLVVITVYAISSLVVDMSYSWFDPRVRLGEEPK